MNGKFFKVNLLLNFNLHAVGRGSRVHFSLSYFQPNILRPKSLICANNIDKRKLIFFLSYLVKILKRMKSLVNFVGAEIGQLYLKYSTQKSFSELVFFLHFGSKIILRYNFSKFLLKNSFQKFWPEKSFREFWLYNHFP